MAAPASTVMRSESTVVFSAARFTSAYAPMSSHSAVCQRGRLPRPITVVYATRPARYASSAVTWLMPGRDMVIAS